MSTEVIPSTRVQLWGARLTGAGSLMSRYALVVILAWFGGGKYAPAATSWLPRRLPHDVGPAAPISSTWPPPVVAPRRRRPCGSYGAGRPGDFALPSVAARLVFYQHSA
jgi:hypothetical protein